MSQPTTSEVLELLPLAQKAAKTRARRDEDALRRAVARLAQRYAWEHYERDGEHVIGAPGTEHDEDEDIFLSTQDVLRVSGSEGRVEWTSVPSQGEREAEARAWSARGRAILGIEDALDFATVVQIAVAAVEQAPPNERITTLADALTLLDHPLSWTIEDERDELEHEDDDEDEESETPPEAKTYERLVRPLLARAREAPAELLDVVASRGVPFGTQLEHHFIELVHQTLLRERDVPPSALRAVFTSRQTDVLQEAWDASMEALGLAAQSHERVVREMLEETDPLDASEEHAWIAGVLERADAEWARLEAKRRSQHAEGAGDWETAVTYADALAEYPCPDSAAFLRALLTRYRDAGAQNDGRGEADLEDALTLAEGRPLVFKGITIPPREFTKRWVAP